MSRVTRILQLTKKASIFVSYVIKEFALAFSCVKSHNGTKRISLKLFLEIVNKRSLIPETSAHFNRLFETSSSPRATASKQTMQNVVMATLEN